MRLNINECFKGTTRVDYQNFVILSSWREFNKIFKGTLIGFSVINISIMEYVVRCKRNISFHKQMF